MPPDNQTCYKLNPTLISSLRSIKHSHIESLILQLSLSTSAPPSETHTHAHTQTRNGLLKWGCCAFKLIFIQTNKQLDLAHSLLPKLVVPQGCVLPQPNRYIVQGSDWIFQCNLIPKQENPDFNLLFCKLLLVFTMRIKEKTAIECFVHFN